MKNDRKNIILQSLAELLEERNLSKITTALLAKKSGITEAACIDIFQARDQFMLSFLNSVMILFSQNAVK